MVHTKEQNMHTTPRKKLIKKGKQVVITTSLIMGLGFFAGGMSVSANEYTPENWVARTPEQIVITDSENYEIQWGDTLWAISEASGVSIEALVEINKVADRDLIYAGSNLIVDGDKVTVKESNGDTSSYEINEDDTVTETDDHIEPKPESEKEEPKPEDKPQPEPENKPESKLEDEDEDVTEPEKEEPSDEPENDNTEDEPVAGDTEVPVETPDEPVEEPQPDEEPTTDPEPDENEDEESATKPDQNEHPVYNSKDEYVAAIEPAKNNIRSNVDDRLIVIMGSYDIYLLTTEYGYYESPIFIDGAMETESGESLGFKSGEELEQAKEEAIAFAKSQGYTIDEVHGVENSYFSIRVTP